MKDFVVKYWAEFAFGLITTGGFTLYKRLFARVHRQFNDQKALKDGTLALLRNEIIHCYDKYTDRKWIPIYGLENVISMYTSYKELGGNGTIDKIVEELKELSSKEPN